MKLRPYRQHLLAKKRCEKLSPKFYGPYKISENIGEVAYWMELPSDASINHVFHVSQLKKLVGSKYLVQQHPPNLSKNFELQVKPKSILGVRWNVQLAMNECLVKWMDQPASEATW